MVERFNQSDKYAQTQSSFKLSLIATLELLIAMCVPLWQAFECAHGIEILLYYEGVYCKSMINLLTDAICRYVKRNTYFSEIDKLSRDAIIPHVWYLF